MMEKLEYRSREEILKRIEDFRKELKKMKKARKEGEVRSDFDIDEEIRVYVSKIKQLLWVLNINRSYIDKKSPDEQLWRINDG